MFRRLGAAPDTLNDLTRVESLVRDRFAIPQAEIILVSEDAGVKPGFPPVETNVVFWLDETRYKLKIFSPVAAVADRDLPLKWLLPSLEDTGEGECC